MHNWIDSHIFVGTTGWIQIVVLACVCFVSVNSLAADFRAQAQYKNKKARQSSILNIIICVLSITGVFFSGFNAHVDNSILQKRNDTLKEKVDSFANSSHTSFKTQSDLIVKKQKETADQLVRAATNLSDLIHGTDSVPLFFLVVRTNTKLNGQILNHASKPAKDLYYTLTNYDTLLSCKYFGKKANLLQIDFTCISHATIYYPPLDALGAGSFTVTSLPLFEDSASSGKYVLQMNFQGMDYEEQCIYASVKGKIYQATRILQSKNRKVIKRWIFDGGGFIPKERLLKVDWDKEFPIQLIDVAMWSPK